MITQSVIDKIYSDMKNYNEESDVYEIAKLAKLALSVMMVSDEVKEIYTGANINHSRLVKAAAR